VFTLKLYPRRQGRAGEPSQLLRESSRWRAARAGNALHVPSMRGHPGVLLAVAIVLAGAATVAMAWEAGAHAVVSALAHVRPGWVLVAFVAQLLALVAYVPSYRALVAFEGGARLQWRCALELVVAGFGAFVPFGGFAHDRRVLERVESDTHLAGARVLGLGALEYAVLAPAAFVAAIVLIAQQAHAQGAVLWSWAICVPVGAALALLALRHRERVTRRGRRRRLDQALTGLRHVLSLAVAPRAGSQGYGGMLGYWVAEGLSLYAAGRALGLTLGLGQLILALGTGYALTRRSMPLAGAGAMMVFMSLALHWVGVSFTTAVAMVVVYHLAGLVLPSLAALWARHALQSRPLPDSAGVLSGS
jgi:uncharacterized membrane protein YbhN (UPF0104 family)